MEQNDTEDCNYVVGNNDWLLTSENKSEDCISRFFNASEDFCPPIFDDWLCWPSTPPGCIVSQMCPEAKHTISQFAYRRCLINGTWDYNNKLDKIGKGFTYYDKCFLPRFLDILKMCELIGQSDCIQITQRTRIIELVGLSLSVVSLLISLFIFKHYRSLKNNRTKIHMNLFVAIVLQVVMRLILYAGPDYDSPSSNFPYAHVCRIPRVLLEYAKTAMFTWMFIEGLSLHNMITVTVFQEYVYIKIYFYVGWIFPAMLTCSWLIVMVYTAEKCWSLYYLMPYYWILEGPRSAVIIINMMFLLNIIRVLIMKLRQSQTSEIVQVRKAVRAAIFLLPLMGIANILFLVDYRQFEEAWKYALWSYTTYFLFTFQGFFVAIFYCFLNGEVKAALKNSFLMQWSFWDRDYIPCRNLTVSSAVDTRRPRMVWYQQCYRTDRQSPEVTIKVGDYNFNPNVCRSISAASQMLEVESEVSSSKNCGKSYMCCCASSLAAEGIMETNV